MSETTIGAGGGSGADLSLWAKDRVKSLVGTSGSAPSGYSFSSGAGVGIFINEAMPGYFTYQLDTPEISLETLKNLGPSTFDEFTNIEGRSTSKVQYIWPPVSDSAPPIAPTDDATDNVQMTTVSREEIDAKLQSSEARTSAQIAGMVSKLDSALAEIRADRVRFTHIDSTMADIKSQIQESAKESRGQTTSIKHSLVGAVLAVAAINIALIALVQSSMTGGKELGIATTEMKQTQEQLKKMQERFDQASPAPLTPASKP